MPLEVPAAASRVRLGEVLVRRLGGGHPADTVTDGRAFWASDPSAAPTTWTPTVRVELAGPALLGRHGAIVVDGNVP
jgi:hypothetical protein